jgi:hypothetical protein
VWQAGEKVLAALRAASGDPDGARS